MSRPQLRSQSRWWPEVRTHFIEVRDERGPSGSPHPRHHYDVAAEVLAAVHQENVRRRLSGETMGIAIAFPRFIDLDPFPLGIIRAFGIEEEIKALTRSLRSTLGAVNHKVVVDEVSDIGGLERKITLAAFVRDRQSERERIGYNERALRRAQRKYMGHVRAGNMERSPPQSSEVREEARLARLASGVSHVRQNVTMRSTSTGQYFSLWIAPVELANGRPDGKVDSYGLSHRAETVSLPHF